MAASPRNLARAMAALLLALTVLQAATDAGPRPEASWMARLAWPAFLYGAPLVLSGFLVAGSRWALMAGVMYGTIGLALDISTVVQELTKGAGQATALLTSGLTGALSFLLILLGGRGFLSVGEASTPPGARPPSRPPRPGA